MQNSLLGTPQGVDSAADEILTAGSENLEPDIVGSETGLFHEAAGKVEVDLRCRGEGDFDFLVAEFHEFLEEAVLLLAVHWIRQRLVSITQIRCKPSWCGGDLLVGPSPVGQVQRLVWLILF